MADPDGLDVQNLKITGRTVTPPAGGAPQKQYLVSYNIGPHGPFDHSFTPAEFNAQAVKTAVATQTQTVREISRALKTT